MGGGHGMHTARPGCSRTQRTKAEVMGKKVLVLRTCAADMTTHGGFKWAERGPVEAPDWEPTAECGNGLHGALWGEGDGDLFRWDEDAKWLVVEVDAADVIDLGGKVKFPRGVVKHCGDRLSATTFLAKRAPGRAIIGGTATAGYRGTATAGYAGTATAGDHGTATAGNFGTATAGNYGTATAGYRGTATAGYRGTATAGDDGTASAGDRGTATAGYRGTATAGDGGTLIIKWWDVNRYRLVVGYVGEDRIESNVAYKVANGKLVKA